MSTFIDPTQPQNASPLHVDPLQQLVTEALFREGPKKRNHLPPSNFHEWDKQKLEKRINHSLGRAIGEFQLFAEGDRVLVALSGGKDSWVLLDLLEKLRKRAPVRYEILVVNIDQGFPGFRQDKIEDYLKKNGFQYQMEDFNVADILEQKLKPGAIPCSLCARLRRGGLIGYAEKYNCNKIAMGHHQDDFIETLLLNAFYVGRLASMSVRMPITKTKTQFPIEVVRPLVYVSEAETAAYAKLCDFPIVTCLCPMGCGQAIHVDHKRSSVKKLLNTLETMIPNVRQSLLSSLGNVQTQALLDKSLWDHKSCETQLLDSEQD